MVIIFRALFIAIALCSTLPLGAMKKPQTKHKADSLKSPSPKKSRKKRLIQAGHSRIKCPESTCSITYSTADSIIERLKTHYYMRHLAPDEKIDIVKNPETKSFTWQCPRMCHFNISCPHAPESRQRAYKHLASGEHNPALHDIIVKYVETLINHSDKSDFAKASSG
jgi:hypothetical protein